MSLFGRARPFVAPAVMLIAVVAGSAACSDGGGSDDATRTGGGSTTTAPTAEPSTESLADVDGFTAAFGPTLDDLGLRVTRAALTDRSSGPKRYGTGDHLAVYLEPIGESTTQAYLDRIEPLVHLLVPTVFERMPDIKSFDLCQEPVVGVDDSEVPVPVTAFLVEREYLDRHDWAHVDLGELIRASRADPPDLELIVSPAVSRSPEWQAAKAAAGA